MNYRHTQMGWNVALVRLMALLGTSLAVTAADGSPVDARQVDPAVPVIPRRVSPAT
jgi:hypothetical protein